MKIGRQVVKARRALGISQLLYAELLGISQQAISKIERDAVQDVSGATLLRLIKHGGLVLTNRGLRAA